MPGRPATCNCNTFGCIACMNRVVSSFYYYRRRGRDYAAALELAMMGPDKHTVKGKWNPNSRRKAASNVSG